MPLKQGNWCYGCGAYEYEAAGEKCKNPIWHQPGHLMPEDEDQPDDPEDDD